MKSYIKNAVDLLLAAMKIEVNFTVRDRAIDAAIWVVDIAEIIKSVRFKDSGILEFFL